MVTTDKTIDKTSATGGVRPADRRRSIRVLIADDHAIVRQALRAVLEAEEDIAVVGEARDGREAVAQAARLRPDVVVMDVAMPRMNGVEATTRIARTLPATRVLALTIHSGGDFAAALRKAGARGYLLKETAGSTLIDAVRTIRRGGRLPSFTGATGGDPPGPERPAGGEVLTERERQVLGQIAAGRTSREIAASLGISGKTVVNHRTHVMRKLSIHNVAGLTRYAVSRGLADPVGPRAPR